MTTSQPSPPFSSSVAISAANPRYIDELRRIGSEYDALARYISTTKLHRSTSADKPTKILSPIQDGIQEYWVQAKVAPDANIYVNVGLGIYLGMPVEEAEQFVESVVVRINHRITQLTQT